MSRGQSESQRQDAWGGKVGGGEGEGGGEGGGGGGPSPSIADWIIIEIICILCALPLRH